MGKPLEYMPSPSPSQMIVGKLITLIEKHPTRWSEMGVQMSYHTEQQRVEMGGLAISAQYPSVCMWVDEKNRLVHIHAEANWIIKSPALYTQVLGVVRSWRADRIQGKLDELLAEEDQAT